MSGDKALPSTIEPVYCTNILSNDEETKAKELVIFSSGDKYTLSEKEDSLGASLLPCILIVNISDGIP